MFEVAAMKCNGIFRYLILKLGYTLWKENARDACFLHLYIIRKCTPLGLFCKNSPLKVNQDPTIFTKCGLGYAVLSFSFIILFVFLVDIKRSTAVFQWGLVVGKGYN